MTKVSKILYPLDFSAECALAAEYVRERARQFQASLTVLHVVDPDTFRYHGGDLCLRPMQEIDEDLIAAHEGKFHELVGRLFGKTAITPYLKVGAEAGTIATFAEEGGFDLIMLPMRRQNLLSKAFTDCLPARVMELSKCPVWTVSCSDSLSASTSHPFTLCAIDFHADGTLDEQNRRILEMSRLVSETLKTKIALLHVTTGHEMTEIERQSGSRADAWLERQLLKLKDLLGEQAACLLESGDVPLTISRAAEKLGAGLVIAGRSHWYSLAGRVQSTVLRIARSCPCPVLSLR